MTRFLEFKGGDTGAPLLVRSELITSAQYVQCDNPDHDECGQGHYVINLATGFYFRVMNTYEEIKEILEGVTKEGWQ